MLISLTEAARKLGIHRTRVFALIKAGRLKAHKLSDVSNSPYLINEKDLASVAIRKPGRPWPKNNKPTPTYKKRRDKKEK